MSKSYKLKAGFSIVEALLAGAILALLLTAVVGAIIYGEDSAVSGGERTRALFLAEEGLEAARNIRNLNYSNLTDGTWGLSTSTNVWTLSGTSNTIENFNRQISIASVDSNTKTVTSTVSWRQNSTRSASTSITARLTNWLSSVGGKGGMLVFGQGGVPADTIVYRNLLSDGSWSATSTTADIDTLTTTKALRAVSTYSSATRNEKIIISRHYNGSAQFIYAQVYNGGTGTWGNVQALSTWTTTNFLDVQNFSGTYLNNGDFMVIYSDNTTIPRARIWNGSAWLAQTSLTNLGTSQIPNVIVARARPGTNEVMAVFFTQGSDSITQYYNGSVWSAITNHSTVAPLATKRLIDFDWSPMTTTKGAMIFANSGTDTTLTLKIWTANGTGGGSWGAVANSTASGGRLGAMSLKGRTGAEQFLACQKDANNDIYCYRASTTPAWTSPTNNILTTTSQTGIQRSFDLAYEAISGSLGLAVYSDNTVTPKYRKYNPTTNAFDAAASSIAVAGGGVLATVSLIPQPDTDDIMVLMGDANNDLRSIIWDGGSDALYTTPVGKTLNLHGITGSATTDFWYDFAWDRF
ncbi:MAG: hypothetical protein Q8L47_03575 [bacterium]|nr:hypothetical protein [bacterium]